MSEKKNPSRHTKLGVIHIKYETSGNRVYRLLWVSSTMVRCYEGDKTKGSYALENSSIKKATIWFSYPLNMTFIVPHFGEGKYNNPLKEAQSAAGKVSRIEAALLLEKYEGYQIPTDEPKRTKKA